jgi:hypothetical protein
MRGRPFVTILFLSQLKVVIIGGHHIVGAVGMFLAYPSLWAGAVSFYTMCGCTEQCMVPLKNVVCSEGSAGGNNVDVSSVCHVALGLGLCH